MRFFRLSGEVIASDLPLDDYGRRLESDSVVAPSITLGLAAAAAAAELADADVVNAHDIDGRPFLTIARHAGGHRIRAHGYADFDVSAERDHVRCIPLPDRPNHILAQLFVDRVLPNMVSRPDAPAFHASAIAHAGHAALFLGDPGLGKSTLASALCPPGEWMCDDSAVLQCREGEPVRVHPSYPFARLFADSLEATGAVTREAASARNSKWRRRRPAATEAQPVVAIFTLASNGPLRFQRLSMRDAITELARHLYRLDPSDRSALRAELGGLERLAKQLPLYEFHYPRRYADLPQVRTALLTKIADPPTR